MALRKRVLLVPAIASFLALMAGVVGLAVAGDWKMLLAIAPNFALTELLADYNPADCLKDGSVKDRHAAVSVVCELVGSSSVTALMLMLPTVLMTHFGDGALAWTWYHACLYAGCVVLPWGYLEVSDRNHMLLWGIFGFAFLGAAVLVLPLAHRTDILGCIQIAFIACLVVRALLIFRRKEVPSCR